MHSAARLLLLIAAAHTINADVGSKACAACHREIFERYIATPMAQSSGLVGTGLIREALNSPSLSHTGATYQVLEKHSSLALDIEAAGTRISRPLQFFIGSGVVGRSYASLIEGFLFQAPVSYYTTARKWNLSPGYEKFTQVNLTRPIEPSCLRCHASRIQHQPGTLNAYATNPFLEGGVSCERCHGPGDKHVKAVKAADIVNPGRLSPARRDSVCAQCHLSGASEIVKAAGRTYSPGGVLADSIAIFVWKEKQAALPVISHFDRMTGSACRKGAPEKFWCGSCHDPHTQPAEATKAAYYRRQCLECHDTKPCTESPQKRKAVGDSCIECHMPRTGVPTVQHATYTDHSIPRGPAAAVPATKPSNDAELVLFGEDAADTRDLALAYADIALRENNRTWGMRAFELLQKAYAQQPTDSKVAAQLAQLFDRMGQEQKACELYASIAQADTQAFAPAANHAACLAKQGNLARAIEIWRDVLERNPALESARSNLAVALAQTGARESALATVNEGLRLNPFSARLKQLQSDVAAAKR